MNSISVINLNLFFYSYIIVGQDSSVGIATGYGLDSTGIEYRWGRHFPYPSNPALGPIQPPIHGYRVPFPWVQLPRRDVDPPDIVPRFEKE